MDISFVICTFNSEATISDTITSITKNVPAFVSYEILLIDNQSKDTTLDIVHGYKNSCIRIISEPDEGYYDALNKGINISRGHYIWAVNSDDYLLSTGSDFWVSLKAQKYNMLHGQIIVIDSKGNFKKSIGKRRYYLRRFQAPFNHPTCVVEKEIYTKYGCYTLSSGSAADLEWMLRISRIKGLRIKYFESIKTAFRLGGWTTTSHEYPFQFITPILKKYFPFTWRVGILGRRLLQIRRTL